MPRPPAVGTGGPGNADVPIDVRKRHPGRQQPLALGFRVAARQFGDSVAAGADVAVGLGYRTSFNWCVLLYTFVPHT